MKKILVIDGNSIINRAFYGVRPLSTKDGRPTNAIFGMLSIISRQLDRIKPDYAAVAFDVHQPTFRHKMYDAYKTGRHPTPEDLLAQFDDAKEVLRLLGLHVLERPGYEADDIQGTIAKMAHGAPDTFSYVLSGDRDLLQLIDDKVTVLLATNADTLEMHRDEFFAKYGIEPTSFVDMKALMGDSSDNIPGVPGIGEKTAGGLIAAFGSLDGVYEHIDDPGIKKGVREKLLAGKDSAYLSKELAAIVTDMPLGKDLSDLRYEGMDRDGLYNKLKSLELQSFISKFGLSAPKIAENTNTVPKDADKSEERQSASAASECAKEDASEADEEAVNKLKESPRLALLADDGGYLLSDGALTVRFPTASPAFFSLFTPEKEVISHDAKKFLHVCLDAGCDIDAFHLSDLALYAYVLDPGRKTPTLSALCDTYLDKPKPAPSCLFSLEAVLRRQVESDGLSAVLDDLELPLLPILTHMEHDGIRIDDAGMREFGEALADLASDLTGRIYMQAGEEFNINSPKQLGAILYEKLGLSPLKKKSKTGSYPTDAETLEELRFAAPIVEDILEYRQVKKLETTYAKVLPGLADKNHRVHTDFKQAQTATGRLSSADPNLQNIPIRTRMGQQMRRYFVADEGFTLVDADYSQIELRLLAHISDDYNMKEAFLEGRDIHRSTAAAVFGVPEEDVTEDMRKRAKAVNFGIVYGISGFSLAKDIGTSVKDATKYIQNYLHNYPFVDAYLERVVEDAKKDGYTKTPLGRRRYIPELKGQNAALRAFGKRVAMNAPIQGAAADVMKAAMIRVYERLRQDLPSARIVMQVHDELLVEVREEDTKRAMALVKEEMENAVSLSIPLTVDVTSGKNWLEQV